ncbi:MAG: DUF309 domain-containing protein [Phycisphaeraceae bacterium]|nr:DUF309 domain-containing protein [Phycisphaeraceae bacterium]
MIPTVDGQDDRVEARLFHEGLRLFNGGQWFEAHETWEDLWNIEGGTRKRFVQGLIQCAVTLEHARRGNPRGVVTVLKSALGKFDGLPAVYMGVDLRRLREEMEQFVRPIRALPAEVFQPRLGRGLKLPVDLEKAPKIWLRYDPFGENGEG